MNGIRIVHQDILKFNDSQGFTSIVSFIKNKRRFSEHGYKCGEVYVMPPFNGECVVLCVHGQVPFLEIYPRKLDVEKHEPIKLIDLIDTDINIVDSCTFELKKVGQKRWRLRAENSLKRDEWMNCIKTVQQSCESELCLDDSQTNTTTEDFRTLLSNSTSPRERKDSSDSNLYSADPVRVSQPMPLPKSPPMLIQSRSFNEDFLRQSPRSVTSVRSLPESSSPRPIRTRRTVLDMHISPAGLSSTLNSPYRAISCPQSPQSLAPNFGRLDFGKLKKFPLDKPIPLPSLPEIHNDSGVDMVETSREFKSNRNSNSSSSNRDSMNSKNSNQENDPHEVRADIYGYYGLLRNFNNNQIYDNSLTEIANEKAKQINLVLSFCTESLKMAKAFGKIWIVGWEPKLQRMVGGKLHYGDHLAAVNGKPVNSLSNLMDLFCGCPVGIPVRLTINPTPFGQSFVLRKPNKGKLPLGIELHKNKNRIESVLPGSVASMAGLPAKVASFLIMEDQVPSIITEVEDHPLDPSSRNSEALQKIDSIPLGQSFTVIIHPRDFVKVLKAESKSVK